MYFHNETAGEKKKKMILIPKRSAWLSSLCAVCCCEPGWVFKGLPLKPPDFNRMLCRHLIVIMCQQIPAYRETWVGLVGGGWTFFCPADPSLGMFLPTGMIFTQMCVSDLSFPHSSCRVTLVSVRCEGKSLVCEASTTGADLCECVNEAFSMPQWIIHPVWSAAPTLWSRKRQEKIFITDKVREKMLKWKVVLATMFNWYNYCCLDDWLRSHINGKLSTLDFVLFLNDGKISLSTLRTEFRKLNQSNKRFPRWR